MVTCCDCVPNSADTAAAVLDFVHVGEGQQLNLRQYCTATITSLPLRCLDVSHVA